MSPMDNIRSSSPWFLGHSHSNPYSDQAGAEYRPGLLSTHCSGGRASGQSVNRTGVSTPIANLGASIPGHPFHTSSYVNIYGEGPYHFYQQEPTYAIPPQVLSCDYTSQMPAMVSENVLCDHGGNQNMGAYSASAPAEQWYPQADQGPMFFPPSYMQPPYVAPSLPMNEFSITSASPEPSIVRNNVIYDTRWNQDMDMYPVHHAPLDVQASLGPMLCNTGDKQPTGVAPLLFEDKATSSQVASVVSTPKDPTHKTDKYCPVCSASFKRWQDRERHKLSHLPRWLQCQDPGCSWRGDRWEHLRTHRLKAHQSSSQELNTRESIIYDPSPLLNAIIDNTTFEIAKTNAISFVKEKAKKLGKLELWGDLFGRRRRSRKGFA